MQVSIRGCNPYSIVISQYTAVFVDSGGTPEAFPGRQPDVLERSLQNSLKSNKSPLEFDNLLCQGGRGRAHNI